MKVNVPVVRCTRCDVPYVLRFSLRLNGPAEWLYQRDCSHKTGLPTGTVEAAKAETAPLVVMDPTPGTYAARRRRAREVGA